MVFRFDLSKGYTQNYTLGDINAWSVYDQSRIDILTDYANYIWNTFTRNLFHFRAFC
ncbi:MAG: hypothetical protein CM15mP107_1750 [Bacteroidota bacterium]|nr:MAG: hypothetical protein CM15mP107_1750 [Bacteroidota bacterium]